MMFTDEQLRILRHMLGIDDPWMRDPKPYRDYYCASPNYEPLRELERLGAVRMYSTRDSYEWFTTTDMGHATALASHKSIRKSKGQRVYMKFLQVSDCWPDLTFRQFLTDPELRETRQSA